MLNNIFFSIKIEQYYIRLYSFHAEGSKTTFVDVTVGEPRII